MKCQNCNAIVTTKGRCQECGAAVVPVPMIGQLAIDYKTVTAKQLSESIAIQKKLKKKIPIEKIWVQKNFASSEQVDLLLTIKEFVLLKELDDAFAKIAVKKGFVNDDQVRDAKKKQLNYFKKLKKVRIIGEILVDDRVISLENCNRILSTQKRETIELKSKENERDDSKEIVKKFAGIRKKDEIFAKLAVKNSVATKSDVVKALKKQVNEFKTNRNILLVGEILYDEGAIEYNQVELILKEQGRDDAVTGLREKYLKKVTKKEGKAPKERIKPGKKPELKIVISDDNMKAYLEKPEDGENGTNTGHVKKLLEEKKVTFGVVDSNVITSFLGQRGAEKLLVAEGKPGIAGIPSKIDYLFDTDFFSSRKKNIDENSGDQNSLQVKKGTVLARKTPMESVKNGTDIFGNSVPPVDKRFVCGEGAKLSKTGLEIVATRSGEVRLSIDEKVFVLSKTNLLEDADVRTGPFDCGNFNISGIVTDAFPIKGGQLKAEEIRGAKLDMIGDIEVDIGIIGAKIKTQGSVKAKYIHNSQIEAFGDVVTSYEILDSNVLSSGMCRSENSKIVASSVSAKKGIFSKGVGTESSIPCMLNMGVDDHILNEVKEIDSEISEIKKRIAKLEKEKESLVTKESGLKKEINENKNTIKKLKSFFQKVSKDMAQHQSSGDRKFLNELHVKKNKIGRSLKKNGDLLGVQFSEYKEVSEHLKNVTYQHLSYKRDSMAVLQDYFDKKRAYINWGEKNQGINKMVIDGDIVSGTTISGPQSSVTTRDDYSRIKIVEVEADGSSNSIKYEKDGKLVNLS